MGDSLEQLSSFPIGAKRVIGFGLYQAQNGERHVDAKPLGSHIEIVADAESDTYRGVYTVKLSGRVYVLHCFKKKSKHGIATPKRELELIEARYKQAKRLHECRGKENVKSKTPNWKR